MKLVIKAGYFL